MHLIVISPNGQQREILVQASVKPLKHTFEFSRDIWDLVRKEENIAEERKVRWAELGNVLVIKMPFFELEDDKVDQLLSRARNFQALVLDVRDNPGGSEEALTRLLGRVFDHDVKVAEHVGRKDEKPLMAKSRHDHAFTGKLVVLVDSQSASAAELLARTVQLEKRGIVMGDRSSGSVMESKIFPYSGDANGSFSYAFEVAVSDLIMADGKSLEHTGVVPDQVILPSREDLAANRDPVLADVVNSVGGTLTADKAGELFPVIWHKPQ